MIKTRKAKISLKITKTYTDTLNLDCCGHSASDSAIISLCGVIKWELYVIPRVYQLQLLLNNFSMSENISEAFKYNVYSMALEYFYNILRVFYLKLSNFF